MHDYTCELTRASIICFEMNQLPGGVHQVKPDIHPAFLKQRQACAEAIAQQEREAAEERKRREEQARRNAPPPPLEADGQWRQQMQGSAAEAYAKVETERQRGLQRQADEKAQHEIEIRLLGRALAEELKPEFQAMTTAIVNAIAQMKENR